MARAKRRLRRGRSVTEQDSKLNLTPMMDVFTIILVFLLKAFSAQGQLVTPASGLTLPTSTIQRPAIESLSVKILKDKLLLEDRLVMEGDAFKAISEKESGPLIAPLYEILFRYAEEAKKSSKMFGREFSGAITIHGDMKVPYKLLTRVMHTCGEAGYPVVKLLVYRED